MIYGYYLIMVMMLPTGDVHGEALDWYFTPYECIEEDFNINMKINHN